MCNLFIMYICHEAFEDPLVCTEFKYVYTKMNFNLAICHNFEVPSYHPNVLWAANNRKYDQKLLKYLGICHRNPKPRSRKWFCYTCRAQNSAASQCISAGYWVLTSHWLHPTYKVVFIPPNEVIHFRKKERERSEAYFQGNFNLCLMARNISQGILRCARL